MVEIASIDLLGYLGIAAWAGCGLCLLFQKWWAYRQDVAVVASKPPKKLTPELIQRRIAKAQWRLLMGRMGQLTSERRQLAPNFASEISSAERRKRDCVGVLSLGVSEWTRYADPQQLYMQPLPLCAENRQKLVDLGFTKFSDDGLWVYYVEPAVGQ